MAISRTAPSAGNGTRPTRPGIPGAAPRPAADRFAALSQALPNGCRRWLGGGGFTLSSATGDTARPQIAAYRLHTGAPKSPGFRVIAVCGFDACVEGAHLRRRPIRWDAAEQNAAILAAVRAGETYSAIGARYALSHQRIHQIVKALLVPCVACGGVGKVLPAEEA